MTCDFQQCGILKTIIIGLSVISDIFPTDHKFLAGQLIENDERSMFSVSFIDVGKILARTIAKEIIKRTLGLVCTDWS